MARVLVLDDDLNARFVMTEMLARAGHEARGAGRPEDAITGAAEFQPDVLVSDWMLKAEQTGLDVAEALRERNPDLRVVFISGFAGEQFKDQVAHLRGCRFVRKPCEFYDLLKIIHELLETPTPQP